jgi:hypothetical protein
MNKTYQAAFETRSNLKRLSLGVVEPGARVEATIDRQQRPIFPFSYLERVSEAEISLRTPTQSKLLNDFDLGRAGPTATSPPPPRPTSACQFQTGAW